jgi:protein gp37
MSDVFHENLTSAQIARIWAVMAIAHQHTYQVLTKRPRKMLDWLSHPATRYSVELAMRAIDPSIKLAAWPLDNVWCGTSVEDQTRAEERVPLLLQVPAVVRFLSMEPLLGSVDLTSIINKRDFKRLHWVIVGGESGPKSRAMHPDWARGIRDACVDNKVSFFFKQVGSGAWVSKPNAKEWLSPSGKTSRTWVKDWQGIRFGSKKSGGRKLDRRLWEQMPAAGGSQATPQPRKKAA